MGNKNTAPYVALSRPESATGQKAPHREARKAPPREAPRGTKRHVAQSAMVRKRHTKNAPVQIKSGGEMHVDLRAA